MITINALKVTSGTSVLVDVGATIVKTTGKLGETSDRMGVTMEMRGRQRTGREGNLQDIVEKEQCRLHCRWQQFTRVCDKLAYYRTKTKM